MSTGEYQYWAFISYSHRDADVARRLQGVIEGYRLPRALRGRDTAMGPLPVQLKPVFRDRVELPAGVALDATVQAALRASRYLIVICSPDAARSAWVAREIVAFKQAHGEGRVLALIVRGEPGASRRPDAGDEECFPPPLAHALAADGTASGPRVDIVAADLRPGGDGWRLATLKVIAGMLGDGTSVDQLARRDAQRRARRMAMIAAGSAIGMAITGTLAVVALRSRAEAERQHAQAEDLIGFMLSDLRHKLDPLGHLDVLEAVGSRALAYYEAQDPVRLDAAALGRRASALHLIGEIRDQRGKLDEALAAFDSAAATTGQALARSPNDPQRIFDHAQSIYWVGYIAYRRGRAEAAEKAFRQYLALAQRLVAIDPRNPDWRLETAYADQNLGVVELEQLQPRAALESFREATDVYDRLRAAKPELANELADSDGWVAEANEADGGYAAAIEAQQARLAALHTMPDGDNDSRSRLNAANAHFALAGLRLELGDAPGAAADARMAVTMSEALAATDASNLDWLAQLSFNRLRLAEAELALEQEADALALIRQVRTDTAHLIASDPSVLRWQVGLAGFALALRASLQPGRPERAQAQEIDAFLSMVTSREAAGTQLDPHAGELVAQLELTAGDEQERAGHGAVAREHWTRAATRLASRRSGNEFPAVTLLARLKLRLGGRSAASELADRVRRSAYRDRPYTLLLKELGATAEGG